MIGYLAAVVFGAAFFATVALATAGALFVAVAELVFFAEFDGRFNFVAVDYLIYPTEVVNNIWESYPTGWLLAGIAAAIAAFAIGMITFDAFAFGQVTLMLFVLIGLSVPALRLSRVQGGGSV